MRGKGGMGGIKEWGEKKRILHSREGGNLPVFEAKPSRFVFEAKPSRFVFEAKPRRLYFDRQSAKARPRFRIILKYRSAPGGMSAPRGSNSPSLMSRPPINARI